MWSEPRRAHPAGVIVYSLRYLSALAAPLVGGLFALTTLSEGARAVMGGLLATLALLVAGVFAATLAALRWYRFTFHIEGGSLRVEQGLIVRKSTRLAPERIQSVDTRANLLFRVLGLVTLDVHTAGRGQEPEVSIPALTEGDARELAVALRRVHGLPGDLGTADTVPNGRDAASSVWELSGSELAIVSVTSSAGLFALAFVGPLAAALLPALAEDTLAVYLEPLGGGLLVVVAAIMLAALLLVSWVFGSATTALQYWEFVTRRTEREVRVERGLFQRNTRNVPLDRVQAVRLTEGLLRQLIGRVTVGVDAAGIGTGGEFGPTVLHPLLTAEDARVFCEEVVPGHAQPPLRALGAPARRRYVVRAMGFPLLAALVLTLTLPYGWLALVIPFVSAAWGVWMWSDAGWAVEGDVLALRWRAIARTTALVRRRRVQSVSVSQHPLQKVAGLATLAVRVAASPVNATFRVRHMAEHAAMDVLQWVSEGVEIPDRTESARAPDVTPTDV